MRKFVNLMATTALIAGQLATTAPALAQIGQGNHNGSNKGATRQAPASRPAPTQKPSGGNYQKPAGGNYQKPAGGYQKPANLNSQQRPTAGNYQKPASGNFQKPANAGNYQKPATRPGTVNTGDKSLNNGKYNNGNKYNNVNNKSGNTYNNNKANYSNNRGGNNNVNINNQKNVVVAGNNRYGAYNPGYYRPPVNRPAGWYAPGYRPPGYRPPGWYPPSGGYYRPFPPPVGGWGGYYYPPSRYYYYNDTSFGEVFAGVLVAGSLVALLSAATAPKPQTVYVQGQPAPPPEPPPMYQPPAQSNGGPAAIRVDLGTLTPEARPSASTCITEAARQIGATGGSEISINHIDDVEQGNGGYRFRIALNAIYPDATRVIPMYCRATPEKIVELTFG
jgi:hypothetical protein